MELNFKDNVAKFKKHLNEVQKKEIPFALARALTDTAKDISKDAINDTYPDAFNIKKKGFPKFANRVKSANKKNLHAKVGNISGDKIGMLNLHQESGTRLPKKKYIAIPVGKLYGKKIRKSQTPAALLTRKKHFIVKSSKAGGKPILFMRKTKKRYPIEPKYIFVHRAEINKTLEFYEEAKRMGKKVFNKWFFKRLRQAERTSKK